MYVRVLKHNPSWLKEFDKEAGLLKHLLGDVVNGIYHIGSTAVPDLMAKPIVDILMDVKDLSQLDVHNVKLESMGYEAKGEMGIIGRRYFRKGGENRTHQIHAFKSGDPNLFRHIAFCEYLKVHKSVADEYGVLKIELAKQCNNNIENYCDGKDAFVKHHEKLAVKWYADLKEKNA